MARHKELPDDHLNLGFRVPAALVARVDAYCEQMAAAMYGHKVSRSDAIRVLLTKALDAEGIPAPDSKPGKRK